MSDNRTFKGHGRGWGEDKAIGWRRLAQIMREPATESDYLVVAVVMVVGILFAAALLST